MPLRDDLAEGTIEVVLRVPNENGIIDTTDRETLETETRFLIFNQDADRGIGELKRRWAFVTWIALLGVSRLRGTTGSGND